MAFNSIYVHIPFCEKRCNYCDFVSHVKSEQAEQAASYADLVIRELELTASPQEAEIRSIYFGGGTPTVLPYQDLIRILTALRSKFTLASDVEITVETNPKTVGFLPLFHLHKAGVNRLSIGAQSFNDAELAAMGRVHKAQDIYDAIELGFRAGFENIGIDLIYGLPGQTMESWQESLSEARNTRATHISLYGLQVDNDSLWGKMAAAGELQPADEDLSADMLELAMRDLPGGGFRQYEIANFAFSLGTRGSTGDAASSVVGDERDFRSRHNMAYWQRRDYLGLGLGAASCEGNRRWSNTGDLAAYAEALTAGRLPERQSEVLSEQQVLSEAAFLGLRLLDGINLREFRERYGVDIQDLFARPIERLTADGLLEIADPPATTPDIPMPVEYFPSYMGSYRGDEEPTEPIPTEPTEEKVLKLTAKGVLLGNVVFAEFIL